MHLILLRIGSFEHHTYGALIALGMMGGLFFSGALLVDIPSAFICLYRSKLPLWKTFDVLSSALVIGHPFVRLGRPSAVCCYGKPTNLPWGTHLHSELVASELRGIPLHPTKMYAFMGLLMLFFVLPRLFKKKRLDGQILLTYLLIYPIMRSVIEVFRGDAVRGSVIDGILSTSQFISLGVFGCTAVTLTMRLRSFKTSRTLNVTFDRYFGA